MTPSMIPSIARALVVDDLAPSRAWLRQALGLAFPAIEIDEAASLAEARPLSRHPPPLALIDAPLAPVGHHLANLRFVVADIRREADGRTYHGIVRLRAVTEPA